MNAFLAIPTNPNAPRANVVVPLPVRHVHRDRDFGVGYGNSSGYAATRHYARDWMQPRFRCA
ncbi:hypothetical protein [Lysobacter changpingensis]|uniref:hypothetical protein n=1 Tax=Lysobacter changpingensis TaxID=2792784 RepID=UPI001A8DB08D|nr:hypothetical protein [Lysobacter changpingensis]